MILGAASTAEPSRDSQDSMYYHLLHQFLKLSLSSSTLCLDSLDLEQACIVLHWLLTALKAFKNSPYTLFEVLSVCLEQLTPG
jgi:hypothetical protein